MPLILRVCAALFLIATTSFFGCAVLSAQQGEHGNPGVTLRDDGVVYTLENRFVTAKISKVSGVLVSLRYHGLETMGYVSGHHAGYWEQSPAGADRLVDKVTIDPATNGGERAEVSVKGWADGKSLLGHPRPDPAEALYEVRGHPERHIGPPPGSHRAPGAGTMVRGRRFHGGPPQMIADMEIRYSLGRDDHGLYTYAIFTHPASYGATSIGESRYGMKLNGDVFDWLSIDKQRNGIMPNGYDWDHATELNMKEARRLTTGVLKGKAEHKYDYCADQFETPAYGWSSTKDHVGLYVINPSMEYLSDGPDHFELTGHIDDGDGGDPVLLDYWRGTHYGGSELSIAAGENWSKVVGPIMLYLDSAGTPDQMFNQAKAQAQREESKWPYTWVQDAEYPHAAERGTVTGDLVLRDPQMPGASLPNLLVGLTYPEPAAQPDEASRAPRAPLTWQNDAKHYEFWTHGTPDGRFTLHNVRPGSYELHAIADGVLGQYTASQPVVVQPGGKVELGKLVWTPVRFGRQLWQIGVPNRSASEFLMGNDHWHWGLYLKYSQLFPHDVDYTVGQSDFHKDWFIYQVPHVTEDGGRGLGRGRATTWTVHFQVPESDGKALTSGEAILRLGLSGVGTRTLAVGVNGKDAGTVSGLIYNATINRDGVEGSWAEKDLRFSAALLHTGANELTLTVPSGSLTSGLAYDVVRLELSGQVALSRQSSVAQQSR